MRALTPTLVLTFLLITSVSFSSSYLEVSQKLKFNTTQELVERKGINVMELIGGLTGWGKTFRDRLSATTTENNDFKPSAEKLLHSRGVCAEATWKIDQDTGASGLFRSGTQIPAIVRFSTGQDNSEWKEGKKRLFGIAVKLFPTLDKRKDVTTANLFLMSQWGLQGDDRKGFFSKPDTKIVYSNVIPEPEGLALRLLGRLFKRFDPIAVERPLWPLAEVIEGPRNEETVNTPFKLNVVAQDFGHVGKGGGDFREEIMSYAEGQMKFDLFVVMDRNQPQDEKKAGELIVGKPFMSDVCDLELHFHHHKNKPSASRSLQN